MVTVPRRSDSGFTIIELTIAVTIIGILAMMAQAALSNYRLHAAGAAYMNDGRVFAAAFTQYAQEHGEYPADRGPRTLPPEMVGRIHAEHFRQPTPLGGFYDWDNRDAYNPFNVRFRAALRINGATAPLAQLQAIDDRYDDGNLSTGLFRAASGGATVFLIIEP
jgi:prepilin-type N-terminal cleavage/methylation domain-containing protein